MEIQKTFPLVSCITPTANRQKYLPSAIKYFLHQDYPNKEMVIIDDGVDSMVSLIPENMPNIRYFYTERLGSIGIKRNYACNKANGEIIMHWDDDDWHANDWISRQVGYLLNSGADICGIEHVHFFSPVADTFWLGTALCREKASWLNGATLAYRKTFWASNPFMDRQTAEDDAFIRYSRAKIYAHDYIDGFVAILHPENTTVKYFENPAHKQKIKEIDNGKDKNNRSH